MPYQIKWILFSEGVFLIFQKEHEERVNTMFGLPPGHMAGVPGQEQNQSAVIKYDYDEEPGQGPGYYNEFAGDNIVNEQSD